MGQYLEHTFLPWENPHIMFAAPFVIILWWFLGPIVLRLLKVLVVALVAVALLLWSARRLVFGRK